MNAAYRHSTLRTGSVLRRLGCRLVVYCLPAIFLPTIFLSTIFLPPIFLPVNQVSASLGSDERPEYARDIRPILADKCFACHGADANTRAADLRLDLFEEAVDRGAIAPGEPDSSELIARILLPTDDPAVMPPVESHKTLSDDEKTLLRQWIEDGAKYQSHWAFTPPTKPSPPVVAQADWVRNDIDRFVLAALEAKGLTPNPQADPATLVRRVALDITGLPPEPELVRAFVANPTDEAYEALIDQLMSRSTWGEQRGRYWLDLARYADTHGIHFDNFREIWAYRDWVIDAFNRNLPFDQFTIEQLAGDLLPNPTLDQQIASGFNRCNITTNEGGVIEEEYRVLYSWDRTETMAQTWMGLTVGCAACHDHKFDPVTQVDFYQLAAFFNNTTQPVMDGNIPRTPPTIFVPRRDERETWATVTTQLQATRAAIETRRATVSSELDAWLRGPDAAQSLLGDAGAGLNEGLFGQLPTGPAKLTIPYSGPGPGGSDVELASGEGEDHPWALDAARFAGAVAPEFRFEGAFQHNSPFSLALWLRFSGNQNNGALLSKMYDGDGYRGWDVWSEGGRIGMHIIHRWPDNAIKVMTQAPIPSDQWQHVTITYDGSQKAAGVKIYVAGQPVATNVANDTLSQPIDNERSVVLFQRHGGGRMPQLRLDDVRLYERALSAAEASDLSQQLQLQALRTAIADLGSAPDARLPDNLRELALARYLQQLDEEYRQLSQNLVALEQQEDGIRRRGTMAHVMNERTDQVPTAFVLHRGMYDQRREQVTAQTPSAFPPLPEGAPVNRLGLAQWLVMDSHPLTTRVTVNQFWQSIFGQGLVATSGDFGLTGTLPSHPELLDHLAVEFREDGWDVKRFFKRVFLSATYRQSAMASEEKLTVDPENVWLSRGPRFRMDAEMVRDLALSASGLLVPEIGGPSVRPYQPPGVWEAVAMIGSNTRDYRPDRGPGLYRRSMYTFWKRSAPPASMDIFNAPSRESCTVRRERTNTPLQALAMLNDPQMIEAARALATEVLRLEGSESVSVGPLKAGEPLKAGDPGEPGDGLWDRQLDFVSYRILSRPFQAREREILRGSFEHLRTHYSEDLAAAQALIEVGESPVDESLAVADLAAWTLLINQVFNLDEALCK